MLSLSADHVQGLSLSCQLALRDELSLYLYSTLTTKVKAYSPFFEEWGPQDHVVIINVRDVEVFVRDEFPEPQCPASPIVYYGPAAYNCEL